MAECAPYDVLIVGGGPAGQAAALRLHGAGLKIGVVDEQPRPGGQILRQPPATFVAADWMEERSYRPLKRQLGRFEAAPDVEWLGGSSVLGIEPGSAPGVHGLTVATPEGATGIRTRRLLVATGCYDMPLPLAGWTLPGLFTTGGLQAFVKSQGFVPGQRIVLVGTHPLQLLVARQVLQAGGRVERVVFVQPRSALLRPFLRRAGGGLVGGNALLAAARAWRDLGAAGTKVAFGLKPVRVAGEQHVSGLVLARSDGTEEHLECDAVGLCFGFLPQSDLPRMAGLAMERQGRLRAFSARHDEWMESDVAGIFVAGETTGVAGADAACVKGALAGLGMLHSLGRISEPSARKEAAPLRRRLARLLAFADLLDRVADPSGCYPEVDDQTILCRCEDVTYGSVRAALGTCGSANAVKLLTRCGMGPCQGRNCEFSLLRLMHGPSRCEDAGFTVRFPVRPVPIGDLTG
ncbi:NAD(P)/FAD-dependent oxidoreductase [Sphingosinicella sp. CPCC 101087]|uniref:FAD/NAD(P)-dependent oxidoreductase n=1 Tax=Sphingosinicella sp. CPCC 101087 TaxID=2497754 RepID=UPI00101E1FED|nr:NAD(P)/FAD-dependent oxidoreductase [Sphingosinicella sp. CPCC 101087]